MTQKVLVPLNGMKYCIDRFLDRVKDLAYFYYDVLMVDNSRDDGYFNELKKKKE